MLPEITRMLRRAAQPDYTLDEHQRVAAELPAMLARDIEADSKTAAARAERDAKRRATIARQRAEAHDRAARAARESACPICLATHRGEC